jgi:hypothetical protein
MTYIKLERLTLPCVYMLMRPVLQTKLRHNKPVMNSMHKHLLFMKKPSLTHDHNFRPFASSQEPSSSRNFSHENYDTLVSKCALYGSKLLKKPDQCRAVYIASHLWWATEIQARGEDETKDNDLFKDDERVLVCLQRALRVADGCMDVAVSVEILNRYLYFFDRGSKTVTVKYIKGLIDLIQTNLSNNSDVLLFRESRVKQVLLFPEKEAKSGSSATQKSVQPGTSAQRSHGVWGWPQKKWIIEAKTRVYSLLRRVWV